MEKGRYKPLKLTGLMTCLCLVLAACSSVFPSSDSSSTHAPSLTANSMAVPKEWSKSAKRELIASHGLANHAAMQAYANKVLNRLSQHTQTTQNFSLTILDTPQVNALALPNGELFVTRGLLALLGDGAEFAAVLSHEMAHVLASHAVLRVQDELQNASTAHTVTELFRDPEVALLTKIQGKIDLAHKARLQELEADKISVTLLRHAGYDVLAARRVLERLAQNNLHQQQKGESVPSSRWDLFASHPDPDIRLAVVDEALASQPASEGQKDEDGYMKALDGLIYGENTNRARLEKRLYINPKTGTQFELPEGFTGDSISGGMVAASKAERLVIRYEILEEDQPLDVLATNALRNTMPQRIEPFSEGLLRGKKAYFQSLPWTFEVFVFAFNGHTHRITLAQQPPHDTIKNVQKTLLKSFRQTEPGQIKPTVIRIQERTQIKKDIQTLPLLSNEPRRRFAKYTTQGT